MIYIRELPFTTKYPVLYVIRDTNNKVLGLSTGKDKTERILKYLNDRKINVVNDIKKLPFSERKKLIDAGFNGFIN